ncbi:nucleotidyltransferase family protein [Nodosilinea sp. AN01ver1]|uniref:nucleotidyltransferase family protein n=1 Tax=Nodosilinea sp. AN01ver1 TaxID=3423362 RepID=UPI003D311003
MSLTDEQMATYRASAQRRQQHKHDRLRQRQRLGMTVAYQARDLLEQSFRVERVVLFGSMRFACENPDVALAHIHERSDVDLAVWGLKPQDYFRAVGQLLALHPNMAVDLVEIETAPPRLRCVIESTGVSL